MSPLPEVVGRFRIDRPLPASGVGRLFAATDLEVERRVVLRVFVTPDDATREQALQTAAVLTRLSHPGLVGVLSAGASVDQAWWVLDLDADTWTTLADAIARDALPPVHERLSRLATVYRAAAYAESEGLPPLDITPTTVWVGAGGDEWRLAGFAIADAAPASIGAERPTPPEAAEETRSPDARSTVFSAGLVLQECLAGCRPLDRDADTELDAIVGRALAKAPADGFESVNALADRMVTLATRLREGPTTTHRLRPHPVPPPEPDPARLPEADSPVSATPEASPLYDENVQFTVYRPRRLAPQVWDTMLVFAHLDARAPDAPSDAPDPVEEVYRQAAALLGDTHGHGQQTVDSGQPVPREGLLIVVPAAEGVEFNPPTRAFQWVEPVHCESFRLRATTAVAGRVVRGRLTVFLGSIILADIPLTIRVDAGAVADDEPRERTSVRPYRRIFASYSHDDRHIVEEFARYAKAVGDRYLRDVVELRSGEQWSAALKDLIQQADVFQLFWSWNALHSPYVRDEWQFALGLQRPSFIRPVYWDDPLPAQGELPPASLRRLHFERISPMSAPTVSAERDDTRRTPTGALPAPQGATPMPSSRAPRGSGPSHSPMRVWRYVGSAAAALFVVVLLWPVAARYGAFDEGVQSTTSSSTGEPGPTAPEPPTGATGRTGQTAPPPPPSPSPAPSPPAAQPPLQGTAPMNPSPDGAVRPPVTRSTIAVSVRDAAGQPVVGATVTARGPVGVAPIHGVTDQDGDAHLDVPAAGEYVVTVDHAGFTHFRRRIKAGELPSRVEAPLRRLRVTPSG